MGVWGQRRQRLSKRRTDQRFAPSRLSSRRSAPILGLFYIAVISSAAMINLRLTSMFFIVTHAGSCEPVWNLFLTGSSHWTSYFQIATVTAICLLFLTAIDLRSYIRFSSRRRLQTIVGYLSFLGLFTLLIFTYVGFYGAMIPQGVPHQVYRVTTTISQSFIRWAPPYWGLPEGPYGSCPPGDPTYYRDRYWYDSDDEYLESFLVEDE